MRALFHECQLPRELPDLDSCGLFSVSELHGATYNPALRKMVLRSYRHDVVKPLLLDLDRQHLMESIIEPVPTFGFSLADLGFYKFASSGKCLTMPPCPDFSFQFPGMESCADHGGRWPLPLLGKAELPQHIACPACGKENVSVLHMLGGCSATQHLYRNFRAQGPSRSSRREFLQHLFGDPCTWQAPQEFVGSCLRRLFADDSLSATGSKLRAVQTVTGERPAFMALPAEHASSHQASMLAAEHESTVVSLIREGSSVDRVNLILSYVCMYGQG